MSCDVRTHWQRKIDDVIRSRHYTWLPEGLGGKPVPEAMVTLIADIRHICRKTGIPWCQVVAEGRDLFKAEEAESLNSPEKDCADDDTESYDTFGEIRVPPDLHDDDVERGLLV